MNNADLLAERGELDYGMAVVEVWPESGVHAKQGVTVRHVLCHTAGVPALPPGTTPEELCDWDQICAVIAGSELRWEPGTRFRLPRAHLRLPDRRDAPAAHGAHNLHAPA
jgi:CubicO group peptidase (beta-lactamase class C family)